MVDSLHLDQLVEIGVDNLAPGHFEGVGGQGMGLFIGNCKLSWGLVVVRRITAFLLNIEEFLIDGRAREEDGGDADDESEDKGDGLIDGKWGIEFIGDEEGYAETTGKGHQSCVPQ